MSTQVHERPTGEQPALDPGSYPYPEHGAPALAFTPNQKLAAGPILVARTDYPALEQASGALRCLDLAAVDVARAVPGMTYAEVRAAAAAPEPLPEADPDACAQERMPIGDTAEAEVTGTRPRPVLAVVPPVPSTAEDLARYKLADIVYAAARHAEPSFGRFCADCIAADAGWCDACQAAEDKSRALDRLHDLILAADSYAAAAVLVAEGWR